MATEEHPKAANGVVNTQAQNGAAAVEIDPVKKAKKVCEVLPETLEARCNCQGSGLALQINEQML